MHVEEVGDGAVLRAIDEIAERAAGNEPMATMAERRIGLVATT